MKNPKVNNVRHVVILKSQLSRLGGLEKYALKIASAFIDQGHRVTFLTTNPPDTLPCPSIAFPIKSKTSVQFVRNFDRNCHEALKDLCPDLILGLDRNRFQTHIRAGNGAHVAYLKHRARSEGWLKRLSFPLNPLHRLLLSIEKESFEHPQLKKLITNSHMVKREILEHYSTDPAKIAVLHNGVDWKGISDDFAKWPSLKPSDSPYHFLFVGQDFRRKGLRTLLEALALIPQHTCHLSIVGKDKEMAAFQQLARSLKVDKQTTFFGERTDIRHFYQLADCLVLPSVYDPFANVTVEALAMGLFVITSQTNGAHEVIAPGCGSVVKDPSNPEELALHLRAAIESPKTISSASKIRQTVQHLDFSDILNQFIGLCLNN